VHKVTGRGSRKVAFASLLGVVGFLAAGCVSAAPPPPAPTVIVYGDSLITQSKADVEAAITRQRGSWRQVYRHYPGTALCDWLDAMRADSNLNAKVVVIEFSGNDLTPCMSNAPAGTTAWINRYTADATSAANIWKARGVKVLFVGGPRGVCLTPPHPLDAVYQSVAAAKQMTFTSAAESALVVQLQPATPGTGSLIAAPSAPHYAPGATPEPTLTASSTWPCPAPDVPTWTFAFEMPCRAREATAPDCRNGVIQVRDGTAQAPGGHFTPSGASRFGEAIANQAVALMT